MITKKKTNWAKRIRTARENSGITQREMAERMGIPAQTLRNWEYGNRSPRGIITEQFIERHLKTLERKSPQ